MHQHKSVENAPKTRDRSPVDESLLPPQNIDAEEAILGSILIDPNAMLRVVDVIKPEDFYSTTHRMIYKAALSLHVDEDPIDLISVAGALHDDGNLQRIGGQATLIRLVDSCLGSFNVDHYARLVASKAKRRQIIQFCTDLAQQARSGELSDSDLKAFAEKQFFELMTEAEQDKGLVHISEYLTQEFAEIERLANGGDRSGFDTGFYDLDNLTYGLQPGKLYIVAGRPGMGKSCLAANAVLNVAKRYGGSCAIFSLEMQGGEIGRRCISAESSIEAGRLIKGEIKDTEWESMGQGINRLSSLPVYVNESTTMSPSEVKSQCMKLKAQTGSLNVVMVDYLHLMLDGDDEDVRALTRYTRAFKRMAGELQAPIVLLSQLNRAVEGQQNKRPTNKDLRASGSIEQDADQIWMLYRDEEYNPETEDRGIAEVIVTKHRGGPKGTVKLLFEPQFTRFRNLAVGVH